MSVPPTFFFLYLFLSAFSLSVSSLPSSFSLLLSPPALSTLPSFPSFFLLYYMMKRAVTSSAIAVPVAGILGEVTEDERARWMRMLVVLGLAGLMIIFTPDVIQFLTGMQIPQNPVDNNNDGLEDTTGLPINTVRATLNLFLILRFMGVAVAVIGGVFSVVKL